MKKRLKEILLAGLVLTSLGLAVCGPHATSSPTNVDESVTVESNFYQATNKDWLKKAPASS